MTTILTFDQLADGKYDQHEIQIRGFLYPTVDGYILAATPNVKSCCLRSPARIQEQILIKDKLSKSHSGIVVNLQGTLRIAPKYNETGELSQYYLLDDVKELSTSFSIQSFGSIVGLIGFVFILFLIIKYFFYTKRK